MVSHCRASPLSIHSDEKTIDLSIISFRRPDVADQAVADDPASRLVDIECPCDGGKSFAKASGVATQVPHGCNKRFAQVPCRVVHRHRETVNKLSPYAMLKPDTSGFLCHSAHGFCVGCARTQSVKSAMSMRPI